MRIRIIQLERDLNKNTSGYYMYWGPRKLNTLRQAVAFHCVFFLFLSAITFLTDHIPIYGVCNVIDKRGPPH